MGLQIGVERQVWALEVLSLSNEQVATHQGGFARL
jgi:hypothetical protein